MILPCPSVDARVQRGQSWKYGRTTLHLTPIGNGEFCLFNNDYSLLGVGTLEALRSIIDNPPPVVVKPRPMRETHPALSIAVSLEDLL